MLDAPPEEAQTLGTMARSQITVLNFLEGLGRYICQAAAEKAVRELHVSLSGEAKQPRRRALKGPRGSKKRMRQGVGVFKGHKTTTVLPDGTEYIPPRKPRAAE